MQIESIRNGASLDEIKGISDKVKFLIILILQSDQHFQTTEDGFLFLSLF